MSLNCVMLTPDAKGFVPLPGEKIFFSQDAVRMLLDCNENGYPGNSGGYWEAKGTVTLSNQRIVFMATPPTAQLQSLNIPTGSLKNWKLEQPWFGANYISGVLLPVPGGGLPKSGKLELKFTEGESNEIPQEYEPLPTYEGPSSAAAVQFPTPAPATPAVPITQQYPPPPPGMPAAPPTQQYPAPPGPMPSAVAPPMPSATSHPPYSDLPPTYEEARRS
ncbi:hypothetical protein EC973_009107 [Apophysomyces ossiformis]|uniref:Uncharacterized protein n=1 Tax=Apophysomyces ossiformis TaxID=679940 RepID=A0A8H7ENN5_9FUNG|nr:hypothetical protein EC973_009107 [Apophysomyces ossiformis]